MSYYLTDEQEHELNLFLDQENRKICEEQLLSDDVAPELKKIIQKTKDAGSPIPAFDPKYGYYSISFTPCVDGNRIYAHHHISNKSVAIFDPSVAVIKTEEKEIPTESNFQDTIVSENEISDLNPEDWQEMQFSDNEMAEYFPPPEDIQQSLQLQTE